MWVLGTKSDYFAIVWGLSQQATHNSINTNNVHESSLYLHVALNHIVIMRMLKLANLAHSKGVCLGLQQIFDFHVYLQLSHCTCHPQIRHNDLLHSWHALDTCTLRSESTCTSVFRGLLCCVCVVYS